MSENRCINCNSFLVQCCINLECKMHFEKKSQEKHIAKFLSELGSISGVNAEVDKYIENDIDRQIEEKKEKEIDAQVDSELVDYMCHEYWTP